MIDKRAETDQFSWRLPLYFLIVGCIVLIAAASCTADIFLLLNVLVIAPILIILSIPSLLYLAFRRRPHFLPFVAAIAVLWTVAVFLFQYNREHPFALHETVKWLVWSPEYKHEVLEQPSLNGDLKHIEWDGSGFAGVANNTAYLVFDPSDSLSQAENDQALRFNGKSCSVWNVRRLEHHWYAVLFYTDQTWDECN
ncbi:MAG: hypothetical protein ACRD4H_00160 [Candidatus Acidiferrales bacterium]